jgi:hypothetical protein
MAHLTGIGIENFRVFKDYTEFDFAPITILTGANSISLSPKYLYYHKPTKDENIETNVNSEAYISIVCSKVSS